MPCYYPEHHYIFHQNNKSLPKETFWFSISSQCFLYLSCTTWLVFFMRNSGVPFWSRYDRFHYYVMFIVWCDSLSLFNVVHLGRTEKMNFKFKLFNGWKNLCFGPNMLCINFHLPRIRPKGAARYKTYIEILFCFVYWVILVTCCPILSQCNISSLCELYFTFSIGVYSYKVV